MRLSVTVGLLSVFTSAAVNERYLSLQGYTGIINTPNALVIPDGRMTFLYTNQTSPGLIKKYRDRNFNNYLLSIGFIPFVEITGRFMNAYPKNGPRDLSADIKCGYDFGVFNEWFPSVAFGMQDISGGAVYLETRYAVISEEMKQVRLSLGYGTGPYRMKSFFWGAELFLTPYLHLLADNDNDQAAVALRFATPGDPTRMPFTAALMIKSIYREKTPVFTFSAAASFDMRSWDFPGISFSDRRNDKQHIGTVTRTAETSEEKPKYTPDSIVQRLSDYGLQNIAVETVNSTVAVWYENNRFEYDETDALGIVLGAVCTMVDSSIDTVAVTTLRSRLPVVMVKTDRAGYSRFLDDGNASVLHLEISDPEVGLMRELKRPAGNASTGKIRIEVSPRLRYFLGTEVGAFDYQVGVNCDAFMLLWPGGSIAARGVVPVWNTRNLDKGYAFSSYREHANFNSAAIHQFINFGHGVTTLLSTGLYTGSYDAKYFSVIDDIRFTEESGFFRGGIQSGYFIRDGYYRTTILPYIGLQLPTDLFLEIAGGIFWEQDTGIDVSLIRRFRSIDMEFFCKRTKNYLNGFDTFVGMRINLPLTPRKGMKPWYVSVSGRNDWGTSLSTRVVTGKGLNYISTSCGVIPEGLLSLGTDYFNRDRLNAAYIQKNRKALRDSWLINQ